VTLLHLFSAVAASRGEGLHPKLQALLERAARSPSSVVEIRHDCLIQAGPSPESEVASLRTSVTLFRQSSCSLAALLDDLNGLLQPKR
jgi:hypothetical protein